MLIVFFLD